MTPARSTSALQAEDERREALRELLAEPFVGSDAPVFKLIRRHDAELARRCTDLLGYRLHITPGFARLVKVPTERMLRRGIRVPPSGTGARDRSRDEWPRLSDRGVVLLFLTLAALERCGHQTVIGELADDVAATGTRAEPPITVDLELRSERMAFADGLELLCHWGVLQLMHGQRGTFANKPHNNDESEALFTVDRRRLALVLRDPFAALAAVTVDDLAGEADAATAEARARQTRHRLARRLLEDPVLYIDELAEDERAYFLSQRGMLERRVEDWTGLTVERRAEGTAAIEVGRELTDLPFPAGSNVKQLALLLCDWLAGEHEASWSELRRVVRALLAQHERHWNRSPDDEDMVEAMLGQVTALLLELDLAERQPDGLRARPLCARFRAPQVREAGAR
jgi:uncharacterized protein (TIGR02678 family)